MSCSAHFQYRGSTGGYHELKVGEDNFCTPCFLEFHRTGEGSVDRNFVRLFLE